jgi:ubiquitin carboxyl-terminal hydrolase 8
MPPSYAEVADGSLHQPLQSPVQSALDRLRQPPALSIVLVAVLDLLEPLAVGQTVYLLPPSYLENWLAWAFHQTAPEEEQARTVEALRLAAIQFGLVPPTYDAPYVDPSPVDIATSLAVEGHPLVLDPTVRLKDKLSKPTVNPARQLSFSKLTIRDKPVVNGGGNKNNGSSPTLATADKECVAVPESFYEILRATHGILCDDGFTIAFQPGEREALLLQHEIHEDGDAAAGSFGQRRHLQSLNEPSIPRPVEFRRKVVWKDSRLPEKDDTSKGGPSQSLMEQLMKEEARLNAPRGFPAPEIHPYQFLYRITKDKPLPSTASPHGWALISSGSTALDALSALLRAALPSVASHSVRLWTKLDYSYGVPKANPQQGSPSSSSAGSRSPLDGHYDSPTSKGDGYEWVDLESLSKKPINSAGELSTLKEWVENYFRDPSQRQVECILEVRPAVHAPWPRQSLLLTERLEPGDFCDAQDIAGNWYEARVVGPVDSAVDSKDGAEDEKREKVKVHYIGWASRWNANVPLVKGVSKLSLPAPLWSRSGRWREGIKVGDEVEVRDSSSIVERPKWYRGTVKKVGSPGDAERDMTGGADLETYPVSPGNEGIKRPVLVLHRSQQILVEVKQERTEKAGPTPDSPNNDDMADPPYLRWVSLYGEEICKPGTHLKIPKPDDSRKPATITYEFDSSRKPVAIMKGHPSLGAGFVRESIRGPPPAPGSVGLHNLGNSCYLNSTVQCMSQVEPVTQYFMRQRYEDDLNRKNPLGSGGHVASAYASLLRKIWGGEHSVLAPRLLKQTVGAFAPQFNNCYQHDSQEFCQFLMDGLHEDLNRVKVKPYVEDLEGFGMADDKAAIESWRKHLLRHDSIVVDHCQGMHRSHLTCPRCGRESIKFDVYSSISLPLAAKKDHSVIQLEDCLERFMEGEQLDERNAWYCPRCRQHVCALKMIALWTTPDVLILHLKRFTFEPNLLSGGMLRSKVDDTVSFPIQNLDLTKHILGPIDPDAPPIYRLIGVSEHIGPTANSGHYTATVRNSIDNQWYRFNDSNVGRTSGEAAMTGGAYMLFYQRSKGYSRWGGMERVMRDRGINPYGGLDVDQDGFKKVKAKKKKR